MQFLKNILMWSIFVPFTFVWFIFILLSAPLPSRKRHHFGAIWNAVLVYLIDKIIGLNYEVVGLENVPDGPCIICCKHQSGYETLALQRFLPEQVFIIKKELLYFPILGVSLYIMNSIPVDRNKKNPKTLTKLIKIAKKRRDAGFWINIFPEGTRIAPGKRGKYKYGAANMAIQLKMDILPIATNSGEFWPKKFTKCSGTAKFVIGKPIPYTINDAVEMTKQCEDWIEGEQLKIQDSGPFGPKNLAANKIGSKA